MRRMLRNNGLCIVLFALFAVTMVGQTLTGLREFNETRRDHGQPTERLVSKRCPIRPLRRSAL